MALENEYWALDRELFNWDLEISSEVETNIYKNVQINRVE